LGLVDAPNRTVATHKIWSQWSVLEYSYSREVRTNDLFRFVYDLCPATRGVDDPLLTMSTKHIAAILEY
jgi:hypothetical protein